VAIDLDVQEKRLSPVAIWGLIVGMRDMATKADEFIPVSDRPPSGGLKRALGLWLLVFYGLGTIIGAGIYVLVGEVASKAGMAAPVAFLLAGLLAALTGLSYAELAARFPVAAGAAAYVGEGLRSPLLSRLTGFAVLVVGLVVAASLARGAAGYLQTFVEWPTPVVAGAFVVLFTAIACLGVRESVGIASLMTIIELLGLVLVVVAGGAALGDVSTRLSDIVPVSVDAWIGVAAGGFAAFFAFIGFESLANMGEEAKDAERTLPRAILLSILVATALYVVVSLVAVLAVDPAALAESDAPLTLVLGETPWAPPELLVIIVLVAVPGGILIDLVMTSRLLYGMARRGLVPTWLGRVNHRSRAPVIATVLCGLAALVLAVGVPFGGLVTATSSLTLLVFLAVNVALWRLQRNEIKPHSGFHAPHWVAPAAAVLCLILIVAELGGRIFG
jgi:APA family basic amino acid/polyamine antiporter